MSAAPGALPDLQYLLLFGLGAFIMRGAGCTINGTRPRMEANCLYNICNISVYLFITDMWDRDIDAKVERTKSRPLVSGEITQWDALVFLSGQLGVGLVVLLQLNWYSILLGASSLGIKQEFSKIQPRSSIDF